METKEKRSDESKLKGNFFDRFCCVGPDGRWMMEDCCKGIGGGMDWSSMMGRCMKGCGWFPLIPVVLGMAFFLLGYYLDAEIIRILWMVAAGLVILMGTLGAVMMRVMIKKMTIQSE
ncbi:MAG: hypothetical protein ACYTEQ_20305 [Planctomycetota bacterium]|jgi:hypothetical protein